MSKTEKRMIVVAPQRSEGERSEPKRSEGATTAAGGGTTPANPEVDARPHRRRFTGKYKRQIVREAAACKEPGEIGALLRREGLYSSIVSEWRRQYSTAGEEALEPRKRGRKPQPANPLAARVQKLEMEKAALEQQLQRAHLVIDFQKKLSQLLGIPLKTDEDSGSNS